MTHPIELLSAYLDGEATLAERRAVEQHLERCAVCRARLADYRALGHAQREATPPVPADLAAAIGARIDRLEAATPRAAAVPRTRWVRPWTMAAAAGLLVAVFAGIVAYRSPDAPRTVSEVAAERAPVGDAVQETLPRETPLAPLPPPPQASVSLSPKRAAPVAAAKSETLGPPPAERAASEPRAARIETEGAAADISPDSTEVILVPHDEQDTAAAPVAGAGSADEREAAPRPGARPADFGAGAESVTLSEGQAAQKAVREPAQRPPADLRLALRPLRADYAPSPGAIDAARAVAQDGSYTANWDAADPARARAELADEVRRLGGRVTPEGELLVPGERAAALFEWLAARGVKGLPSLDEFGRRGPVVRVRFEP